MELFSIRIQRTFQLVSTGKIKKALEFQCPTPRPSCVIAYLLSNKLPNIPRTISINSNVNINSYYSIFIIIIVKNHYLLSYSI